MTGLPLNGARAGQHLQELGQRQPARDRPPGRRPRHRLPGRSQVGNHQTYWLVI